MSKLRRGKAGNFILNSILDKLRYLLLRKLAGVFAYGNIPPVTTMCCRS
jgi:hypothetical protein